MFLPDVDAKSPKRGGTLGAGLGIGIGEGMPVCFQHAIAAGIPIVMTSTFWRFAEALERVRVTHNTEHAPTHR